MDTIIWPPTLALLNRNGSNAFAMRLLKEGPVKATIRIKAVPVAQGLLVLEHEYLCEVTQAHYLATVQVRPLEGKRLPSGNLKVTVDGEPIIEGPITRYLPDPGPLDCMSTRRWKKTREAFLAVALMGEHAAPEMQIGFMAINRTKVQVYLSKLVVEEEVPLEIMLVSALYTTKKETP